jgi:hypothetical protein
VPLRMLFRAWAVLATLFCAGGCAELGWWANNRTLVPDPAANYRALAPGGPTLSLCRVCSGSGGWICTNDLQVMSLTRYCFSTPHQTSFVAQQNEAVKPSTAHPTAGNLGGQANGGLSKGLPWLS